MTAAPAYSYNVYGWTVGSDFPLPHCRPAAGAPDMRVRLGLVPAALAGERAAGAGFAAADGALLLWLPLVARFLVQPAHITVELAPGASPAVAGTFVLASPAAGAGLLAGALPLHAAAVQTPRGTVLIAGAAAIGKSTLAIALAQRGGRILSDDLCLLTGSPARGCGPTLRSRLDSTGRRYRR